METFLLCSPEFFQVDYSINPWMTGAPVNKKEALSQWDNLVKSIQDCGGSVKLISPVPGLPDMVFTANSGIVNGDTCVISTMKHKERQRESFYFQSWFKKNGYNIVRIAPGLSFEGRGDTLVVQDRLIGGYGYRSDLLALEAATGALGLDLISLELSNPRFYHLDTCFCLVSEDRAIYFPEAFKKGEIQKLKSVVDLIPISEADARLFMCNSMLVNDTLLIPSNQSQVEYDLKNKYGIKTLLVDVSEFLKSGGSIQCLCLKL